MPRMTRSTLLLAALSLALPVPSALAQDEVPDVLAPWVPWVTADLPYYGCTPRAGATDGDRGGEPLCSWPALLEVTTEDGGGTFVLTATLDREGSIALPGAGRVLPIDVEVDSRPAVVLSETGVPAVRAGAGEHRIEGRFVWETPPETLSVPTAIARVFLVEDGVRALAARGSGGEVWLHARETEAVEEDRVTFEVHRRLSDGSPMALTTRIVVRVAGRARELAVGDVLPDGAVPIDVTADLPARMQPNGELTLQLHAGEFTVTIEALVASPETSYRRPELGDPWPAQEVWVWAPNERFRQVELSGADGIDPARTSLPPEWTSYSAYLLDADAVLTLTTSRRGEPTPPPDELSLSRSVWLDATGDGFTVQDSLTLTMHGDHRIALSEGDLGRMTMNGADQLITIGDDGRPGIELRATSTSITAEWRHEGAPSDLPAVGWSEDAQSSYTSLNLPPGWELIHATGVDRAPGTWVSRWTLLGFFALLIIAAAIGRVMGLPWGLVAFVGVGLTFHQEEAPRWIWLGLAVLLALHRALAGKRFERWIRWAYLGTTVVAVLMTVIFSAYQLRNALYPQLAPAAYDTGEVGWGSSDVSMSRSAVMEEAPASVEYDEGGMGGRGLAVSGEVAAELRALGYDDGRWNGEAARAPAWAGYGSNSVWLDPNAIVQTGFGTPTWSWSSYALSFDGPVSGDHRIGLWLSPPWLTRLVTFLRAVFMLALLALALRKRPVAPPKDEPKTVGAVVPTVAAALLALAVAAPAHAQDIPTPEMLEALRERLARPAECDRCAEANRIAITIDGDRLAIDVEVSAASTTAYPLPGPSDTWVPETVLLDGRPTGAVVRLDSGFLHARVPEGVHLLRLEGPLGGRDAVTLAFGRAPRALAVTAEGWEVDGLAAETVPGSIQLRRLLSAELTEGAAPMRSELPTWLEIERRIDIGVRWTLSSTVRRRSPGDAPAVVRIPLLPGESVNSANVTVQDGQALVTLGQTDAEVSWSSTLTPAETVTLTAPGEGLLSEVWVLACSPLWHCESSGIHPTETASGASWEPRFHPWPGESLAITLSRPEAAEGQSVTVDRATATVRPGVRLTTTTIELGVRTSVSTSLRIDVPSGSDVRSLNVDHAARPLQREGDTVVIALQPGSHTVTLELQEGRGWAFAYETPSVTLGTAAVNLELVVEGSSDRWVLWIAGPAWGPAVLFWPYLALVLVLAYALSLRRTLAPKLHDWVLLLVGLTQIPAPAALIVVGWFFLMEQRRSTKMEGAFLFDVRQLFVIGYTLVAFGQLIWAIESGLLGDPQMSIEGPGSWDLHHRFFVDRSTGALPVATLFSVPTWVFRVLMFLWALWLAFTLLKWARWGWDAFKEDGLFRPLGGGDKDDKAEPAAPPEPTPPSPEITAAAAAAVEHVAPSAARLSEAKIDVPPEPDEPADDGPSDDEPSDDGPKPG